MPYHATVTDIENLAPRVLQLTIALGRSEFRFMPGQWVNFRFPEGVSRAYTIASPPHLPESVQLCIRLGEGRGGAALQNLKAGAAVTVDGPHGDFVLPDGDKRSVVFLAGDVGIAPIRSIVLFMLAHKDPRTILVLYEPDQRYILYAADFDPLARNKQITHVSGAIETVVPRHRSAIAMSLLMAAGFDPFLNRARVAIDAVGADSSGMIIESFGAQP